MFVSGPRTAAAVRAQYAAYTERTTSVDLSSGTLERRGPHRDSIPVPRDVRATFLPSGSVYLSWGAAMYGFVSYEVRYDSEVLHTDDLGLVLPGAAPGEDAEYRVRTVIDDRYSAAVTVTVSMPAAEGASSPVELSTQ